MMPIPLVTTIVFCVLQTWIQLVRIQSCFGMISKNISHDSINSPTHDDVNEGYSHSSIDNEDRKVARMLLFVAVLSVGTLSIITSNIISRSLRDTDKNIVLGQQAAQKKQVTIVIGLLPSVRAFFSVPSYPIALL